MTPRKRRCPRACFILRGGRLHFAFDGGQEKCYESWASGWSELATWLQRRARVNASGWCLACSSVGRGCGGSRIRRGPPGRDAGAGCHEPAYHGDESLPFEPGDHRRLAVKIVDVRGIESLKVVAMNMS